ncbi:hypothetical protein L3X38_029968 [Prunus dulcis]|uniref:NFXL1 RRM-like domain-containing protein n=1 Tax=Prunus dulcis TaxID=3755 RepID=A0AAD4VSL6_PRUDU|nr:hypothetical protein L3X38_029968 [Prunus dulcis]
MGIICGGERCKYLVLGKSRGPTSAASEFMFSVQCCKEKRDVVRMIAERWKLAVQSAGWEPKRFIVVHVTPKSKTPARVIGVKGYDDRAMQPQPPAFDHLSKTSDPRLVVSFPDQREDADISALVLRYGGAKCELVWLNDKNALAVFNDPCSSSNRNEEAVIREPGWREDSWGDEEWAGGSADVQASVWKKEAPITASLNRWSLWVVLNPALESNASGSTSAGQQHGGNIADTSEVVDDWEKAYE